MTNQELKEIRLRLGLTQMQMGLLFAMDQRNYSNLETGAGNRKPTKQHAAHIKVLEFITDKGLLSELLEYINET
jgi:transcriptional regulator with XRE-family HTH domain